MLDGLLRIGFVHHQQIIWDKARTVLTRTLYWFQHEPCWFVRKKNAAWYGKAGENSTIWDSPSPKFIMGGSDEEKYDHPTQKPVELMRRPILNHTKRGELVYEPFLGSGTTLAAAELTERVCYGMELDPKYVDVIVQRWQTLVGKKATLDGDGRTFEEIARGTPEGGSMNRSLPPGDRGSRSATSRGASRSARPVPGAGGLVGGTAATAEEPRIGPRCATVGPRSRRWRQVGVWAHVAVTWAGEGIEAAKQEATLRRYQVVWVAVDSFARD